MIRSVSCVGFLFILFVGASVGQEKKTETILIETTAEKLAKEFADDERAATKKYDPNPPKKKGASAGGAVISMTGELDKMEKTDLWLKVAPPIKVLIKAKKVTGMGKSVQVTGARFKEFKNKTVIIEAEISTLK